MSIALLRLVLWRDYRAGQRILRSVRAFVSDKLKLVVNEAKCRVVKLAGACFLGFRLVRRKVRWTKRSQEKFKAKVRQITKRTGGHSPPSVIAELATCVRDAFNDYEPGVAFGEARELDGWIRSRVRLYYWTGGAPALTRAKRQGRARRRRDKQWGRPRTRRRKLLSLRIGRDEVHKASRSEMRTSS